MAPETVLGDVRTGEAHLVDIYALGVTAFELLTGTLPYDAEQPIAVLHQHLHDAVPRMSERAEVPPLADDIVFEMMSKAPADRPAEIRVVAEVFGQLAQGRTDRRRRPRSILPGRSGT